ncbi:nitroreductase family deazaflavin-dependent oxidoreductase [Agromyces agglutinans]|uniref:nitroreductase family deazaflavin-dependent oxidoreductase n=1 Tax=Agromyces agglutinans TaxID=2662258 RepID=UPI001C12AAB4|nr:nitroreductase family deazaflavin-dependent oxidoreductase [Agromyces agglutinans]
MTDRREPSRTYRPGARAGWVNRVTVAMARRGLLPRASVLTTRGRRSGQLRVNPVTPIEVGGRHWLVSPYGEVGWVHNVRANRDVTLARRRTTRRFTVREVGAEEAGPVLKRYAEVVWIVRPYFLADHRDPVSAFVAEAARHPVFELVPAD